MAALPLPEAVAFPSLSHLTAADYEKVYEPQEDTWLFCDALAGEMAALRKLRPSLVVEVGPGTGAVSTFLLRQFVVSPGPTDEKRPPFVPLCIAVDINAVACDIALRTAQANLGSEGTPPRASSAAADGDGGRGDVGPASAGFAVKLPPTASVRDPAATLPACPFYDTVNGDLLHPLLPRLQGGVDVLLFNAPYVPTPDDEIPTLQQAHQVSSQRLMGHPSAGSAVEPSDAAPLSLSAPPPQDLLAAAWAGGDRGRLVIDRMLPLIVRCLSRPRGVAYLVLVEDNDPDEIAAILGELSGGGLMCKVISRRKAVNEELLVMRVRWKPGSS